MKIERIERIFSLRGGFFRQGGGVFGMKMGDFVWRLGDFCMVRGKFGQGYGSSSHTVRFNPPGFWHVP